MYDNVLMCKYDEYYKRPRLHVQFLDCFNELNPMVDEDDVNCAIECSVMNCTKESYLVLA